MKNVQIIQNIDYIYVNITINITKIIFKLKL